MYNSMNFVNKKGVSLDTPSLYLNQKTYTFILKTLNSIVASILSNVQRKLLCKDSLFRKQI